MTKGVVVLSARIELAASSLPRMRPTTELRQHVCFTGDPLTKGMPVAHRRTSDTLSYNFVNVGRFT